LVVVEVTLVRWGWLFEFGFHTVVFQVIWVLGLSMLAPVGLVLLPLRPAHVGALGLTLILGHDLLDGVNAAGFGGMGWLWLFVHERGVLTPNGHVLLVIYPLVPWVGVMAAGCGGPVFMHNLFLPAEQARRVGFSLPVVPRLSLVRRRQGPQPRSLAELPLALRMRQRCTRSSPRRRGESAFRAAAGRAYDSSMISEASVRIREGVLAPRGTRSRNRRPGPDAVVALAIFSTG
jgi:hypothetical protein